MTRWSVIFFVFFWRSTLALEPSPLDIKHYVFRLELNDTTDVIKGDATVRIRFNNPVKEFEIDLMSKITSGKGMRVAEVRLQNEKVNYTHSGHKLKIALPRNPGAGEELVFTIAYSGIPDDGLIISKNKFGDRTFFGDNWPNRAHHWLPVIDHPSDKASVEFIVIAPWQYEVVGNGVKMEESILNPKQKLTHWKEEIPISVKVMVVGVAKFAIQYAGEVHDISIQQWVYPQNRESGFHDYAAAEKILSFFIARVGPYPFRKLANVQSKTKYGGMENASNIFYTESSVNGKADHDDLIAHEIAHQWFGNSATESDWHHIWLSEGFATYLANVYNEFAYGEETRALKMKEQRQKVIDFSKTEYLPVVFSELPAELLRILTANSYQKGSWILHMLRKELGDDVFWKGIRSYYKEYTNSNASTADFRKIMEKTSGKDLSGFFDQWLYKPGHPVLEFSWTYNVNSGTVDVSITQFAAAKRPVFNFPLEIGIQHSDGSALQVENVRITSQNAKFSLKTDKKPANLILDPNANLLFELKSAN